MNRFLAILLLCFPLALAANETKDNTDPKYLENAITLVDGKVTFQQTLEAPSLSKEELYDLFLNWANERFKPSNEKLEQNRVVYTNPQEDSNDAQIRGTQQRTFEREDSGTAHQGRDRPG